MYTIDNYNSVTQYGVMVYHTFSSIFRSAFSGEWPKEIGLGVLDEHLD